MLLSLVGGVRGVNDLSESQNDREQYHHQTSESIHEEACNGMRHRDVLILIYMQLIINIMNKLLNDPSCRICIIDIPDTGQRLTALEYY